MMSGMRPEEVSSSLVIDANTERNRSCVAENFFISLSEKSRIGTSDSAEMQLGTPRIDASWPFCSR